MIKAADSLVLQYRLGHFVPRFYLIEKLDSLMDQRIRINDDSSKDDNMNLELISYEIYWNRC